MIGRKQIGFLRELPLLHKIWFSSIITSTTVGGAWIGWEMYGPLGAIALAVVGFVVGVIISSPCILLQLLT